MEVNSLDSNNHRRDSILNLQFNFLHPKRIHEISNVRRIRKFISRMGIWISIRKSLENQKYRQLNIGGKNNGRRK